VDTPKYTAAFQSISTRHAPCQAGLAIQKTR